MKPFVLRAAAPGKPGLGRHLLWLGFLVILTAACRSEPEEPEVTVPVEVTANIGLQERTFEALWSAVDEHYLYIADVQEAWRAARDQYLPQARTARAEDFPGVVSALLDILPPEAVVWQSRADRIEQVRSSSDLYEGIGAFVSFREEPEPHLVVLAVVPDSPAEQAGLQAHESILAIDNQAITREEGLQAVQRIRGPAGSEALLTVRPPAGDARQLRITRTELVATAALQAGEVPEVGIGYLLFPPVSYETIAQDLIAHWQNMTSSGEREMNGLILDLRVATSGGTWPVDVLLTILADGEVGEFITLEGTTSLVIAGQDVAASQTVPIVVLVGPETQGPPEVLAGLLQSSGRATVIGQPTIGRVERQEEFTLPDGSRAFILTASFRTLAGRDIGQEGLAPDIQVEADWDEVFGGMDPVLDAAVDWLLAGSR